VTDRIEEAARAIALRHDLDPDDARLGYPAWRISWILEEATKMVTDEPIMFKAGETLQAGLAAPVNPWGRISEIATRLGVKPTEWGKPGTIVAKGADGNSYDIWEVMIAFLDRMDENEVVRRSGTD
jgi:hypothetical protein